MSSNGTDDESQPAEPPFTALSIGIFVSTVIIVTIAGLWLLDDLFDALIIGVVIAVGEYLFISYYLPHSVYSKSVDDEIREKDTIVQAMVNKTPIRARLGISIVWGGIVMFLLTYFSGQLDFAAAIGLMIAFVVYIPLGLIDFP